MRVLIFPRYDFSQAATRVRVLQYLPYLKDAGIDFEVFPILDSDGIIGRSSTYSLIKSRIRSYFRVAKRLFAERGKNSVIHIHSELFPFLPFWLEFGYLSILGERKFVIELDDAWFHRYDNNRSLFIRIFLGKKIYYLMKHSSLLIAGNQYIADRGILVGAKHIIIIPTVVDVAKYKKFPTLTYNQQLNKDNTVNVPEGEKRDSYRKPVIGWIGSPATTKFLLTISEIIKLLDNKGIATFEAIGADPVLLRNLPVRVIPWSETTELESLNKFDIGIMPLIDSLFERGKCGFKLIQYMACGLPVVASPVGANTTIVVDGVTGYLASSADEWVKYLSLLCNDYNLRESMGKEGFKRADALYNLKVTSIQFVDALKSVVDPEYQ